MYRPETRSLFKKRYFRYLYYQMSALRGMHTEEESHKNILPTFRLALNWPDHVAISDEYGHYTYRGIFNSSKQIADLLNHNFVGKTQERVSFLCPNDASYVIAQWACWMSGQIAVPLSHSHPEAMLEYFIKDSDSEVILTTNEYIDRLEPISKKTGKKLLAMEDDVRRNAMVSPNSRVDFNTGIEVGGQKLKGGLNPNLYSKLNAMIIYTSGSTGPPKGVLISFANLHSQVNSLIQAWKWKDSDSILHALPLHHVHGVINALMCPLHVGARCVMLRKFDACNVWSNLLSMEYGDRRVNVFMGVPTMYVKLIDEYKNSLCKTEILINYVKHTCSQKVRLMVSGSAALSGPIACEWERITGHRLLERYGMTEIGMALSNPLDGQRKLGFVGTPLPGVSVRIMDADKILVEGNERGTKVLIQNQGMKENINTGQLQVKGKNVFKEYWNKPSATSEEFTTDGWFKTGDTVQYIEDSYRILGRTSVDIIKTGGYKVSALFIETILLQHPSIKDVSVVGAPDSTWGQKVAAVIVSEDGKDISVTELRVWASNKLPQYSIPTVIKMSKAIERNLMGKVNKKILLSEYFPEYNRK